jgi:hypothetical protein
MSMQTRTTLATLLRHHAQGFLSDLDLYHAIADLMIEGSAS